MGGTNYGSQTIVFNYKYPAKGRDFSKFLRGIIKPGVYSGFAVTKTGDNTVSIATGILAVQSSTDKLVIIKTASAITLNVTDSAPVIYVKFDWVDATGNYADFTTRADTGKLTNEVQLCKVNFAGGIITTIDYADKDFGIFDGSFNMYVTGELNVDTIVEKTLNNGVDLETIHFENGDISNVGNITLDGDLTGVDIATIDTINEKTTDNGIDIEGVHLENNVVYTDKIQELTSGVGVGIETIDGSILRTKIINIGDWNMDTTNFVDVLHKLTMSKIRDIKIIIRDDYDDLYLPINWYDNFNSIIVGTYNIQATVINITRIDSAVFDSEDYNATSFNRGWITIWYID